MSKSGAILLSGIRGVTRCFNWAEINNGWRVGCQVRWWLILMVGCDRAIARVDALLGWLDASSLMMTHSGWDLQTEFVCMSRESSTKSVIDVCG
jgi:hypothetical protein